MSNNSGLSKLEELRNLEKLYTQSKQSQNKNTKYKEFDLSYKYFCQYNDLVSKQKILDEKNFYKKIQIGQSKKEQNVNEESSSDEEEKEIETLFEQEKDKYEEHIDSTQAESLLQEFYQQEKENDESFIPSYNDEYNTVKLDFEMNNQIFYNQNIRIQENRELLIIL